ncbi:hypothetical protein, partial [Microcoleus anatoxicus]
FQMEFPASDGSKYTVVFQDDADGRFVESVIFVPNRTTGVRGSTTRFSRDGTRADITVEGSNETARIENQPSKEPGKPDQGVISRLKDGQIIDTVTVPLPIEPTPTSPTPEPPKPTTPPTVGTPDFTKDCESVKKFCEGTGKIAKVVDFAANALVLGGLLFAVPSGGTSAALDVLGLGLKGVSTALKVVDYSCKLLTGSDKDLGDAVIDEVKGIGVEKVIKSSGLAEDLEKAVGGTLDLSKSSKDLIDSFGKEKPTEPSKTNFLPQIRKFLADKTGIPFDFCDRPATTPAPAPTCLPGGGSIFKTELIPETIPYGQTAQYKITYCDPKGEIDNIHIELNAGTGTQTKDIPLSSASGTVSFEIRNKPNALGDCYDLNFEKGIGVSLSVSATSGGRRLVSFGNFRDVLVSGNLPNAMGLSSYCDAELV